MDDVIMEDVKIEKKKKHDKNSKEIETLKSRIKELEEKILYKDAELINYRKRKDDEVSNMLKYANSDMIIPILTIVDDFERAISLDDNILDDEVSKFLSGFKMIYTRLKKILDDFEVKEIDALNKAVDNTITVEKLKAFVNNVKLEDIDIDE